MQPVLFSFLGWRFYSYGLLIAVGGLAAYRLWHSQRRSMGLRSDEDFWLLLNFLFLGGFIGGRILYLVEYVPYRWPELKAALFSFNSGFSVLGAFGGVVAAVWVFACWRRCGFLSMLDHVCLGAALWHVFGRLGCFAAGCCYGRPTVRAWGVRFTDPSSMVPVGLRGVALHPTQLYEAAGELLIFLCLWLAVRPCLERGQIKPGFLTGAYFLAYSILRFSLEFWRGDTAPGLVGLSAGQILSLGLGFAGLGLILWRREAPCILS